MLMKLDEKIFHTSDLANLWSIYDKNTLYTTLKRYTGAGLIYRVYKGLYSSIPPSKLDPYQLAIGAIHGYCYISTETVLFNKGLINQSPSTVNIVSAKSITLKIMDIKIKSRRLKDIFLYNPAGISEENGIRVATPMRAIADTLYFNGKYHFDRKIDWKKVMQMQKEVGYPLTPERYDFARSKNVHSAGTFSAGIG